MATRASSPYGAYGQTGPFNQKNDQWNTRMPSRWQGYSFGGGDTDEMMANPQMQQFTSMLRGPDGQPLEEPPAPAPARFGGGRASMDALLAEGSDPNSLRDNIATGSRVIKERGAQLDKDWISGKKLNMPMWQPHGLSSGPLDHFLTAMVGKEANTAKGGGRMKVGWGSFGRTTAEDPALGTRYDLDAGEYPPSEYTPEQMNYIGSSQPAMNALRRASGRSGVLL